MYVHRNKENNPLLCNNNQPENIEKIIVNIPISHRQFGKDITKTNLTAYLHKNKEEKMGFVNAFETMKANQEKDLRVRMRPAVHFHKRTKKCTGNSSFLKESENNTTIPMYFQCEPKSQEKNETFPSIVKEANIIGKNITFIYPSTTATENSNSPVMENPQYVNEYQDDILQHLKSLNNIAMPEWDYMKQQTDINNKMRAIVFDWLLKVCMSFKCKRDTIFITANILDRYLSKVQVPRSILQLVSVSAFLIACKYEEIYVKDIKQFSYITNDSCSVRDILRKENEILHVLNFDIFAHTPLSYLDFIAIHCKFNNIQLAQANYLLEMSLIEGDMKKYSPCVQAVSAGLLVDRFQQRKIFDLFKDIITEESVEECVNVLLKARTKAINGAEYYRSLQEKYSRDSYYNVARYDYDINTLNINDENF